MTQHANPTIDKTATAKRSTESRTTTPRTKRIVAGAVGAIVAAGLLGSCGIAASRESGQQAATTSTAAPPTTTKDRPTNDDRRPDDDTTDAGPRHSDSTDRNDSRGDGGKRTTTTTTAGKDRSGSPTSEKAEYITKANAVCRASHDELADLGSAPEDDPEAANAFAEKGVDIVQRQLDGLKAIPKPAGDEAKLDEMLGHVQGIVDAYKEGFEAGKAGDQAKVDAAHKQAVTEARAADRIALAYGLDVCAE